MAKTKPRKPQTLRKALGSALVRLHKRALQEGDKEVESLIAEAGGALMKLERKAKAAELRAEADALEARNAKA